MPRGLESHLNGCLTAINYLYQLFPSTGTLAGECIFGESLTGIFHPFCSCRFLHKGKVAALWFWKGKGYISFCLGSDQPSSGCDRALVIWFGFGFFPLGKSQHLSFLRTVFLVTLILSPDNETFLFLLFVLQYLFLLLEILVFQ